jgi:chromosome partitioning protein
MRGDGVVQRGLGWPEMRSVASLLARRHASIVWVAKVPRPLVDVPVVELETGTEHEGGVGWPEEPEARHGRHALPDDSAKRRSAADRAEEVSRETAPGGRNADTDSGPSRAALAGRSAPGDTAAAGNHQTGIQPTETSGRSAAAGTGRESAGGSLRETTPAPEARKRARIPRHAAVKWSPQRDAGQSEQESHQRPDMGSVAGGRGVWALPDEGPIRGARTSEGSDSPMIAGTYPGALSAPGESEDEVAIPAPDTSADTPIARAAQAAMKARAGGQAWPRPETCRILTIANQKGGVGKTTTAVNLAASLAMNGSRVLVVDLDPQGNASTALDVEHRSGTASIYNVLVDGQPLADVIRPVSGFQQLFCAPATIDLAGSEIELVPLVAREARLARAMAGYDASGLDYIFIDCPPSLGLLTVNALVAAPEVLIPIQCEYYALEGLEQLLRTIDLVKSHLNPGLKVTTILLTMYDSRTRLASQVAEEVRGHFGDLVLGSVIPRSVRVSEAPSYGQSVMTYDPGSSGALAYLEAAKEMAFQNPEAAPN